VGTFVETGLTRTSGYCVYSVGPNRQDDGERDMPSERKEPNRVGANRDITFVVTH